MKYGRFEWDDAKAEATRLRRGLSFDYAATVFDDLAAVEVPDRRKDYGEERFRLIGRARDGLILAVIYTERGERTRIISARRAAKHERALYDEER
jgi:uncharacterized DUF497 family protein